MRLNHSKVRSAAMTIKGILAAMDIFFKAFILTSIFLKLISPTTFAINMPNFAPGETEGRPEIFNIKVFAD